MSRADLLIPKPMDYREQTVTPQYWKTSAPRQALVIFSHSFRWVSFNQHSDEEDTFPTTPHMGSQYHHSAPQTTHAVWSPNGEINLSHKNFILEKALLPNYGEGDGKEIWKLTCFKSICYLNARGFSPYAFYSLKTACKKHFSSILQKNKLGFREVK